MKNKTKNNATSQTSKSERKSKFTKNEDRLLVALATALNRNFVTTPRSIIELSDLLTDDEIVRVREVSRKIKSQFYAVDRLMEDLEAECDRE